jgi:hypothetical protein
MPVEAHFVDCDVTILVFISTNASSCSSKLGKEGMVNANKASWPNPQTRCNVWKPSKRACEWTTVLSFEND